MPAARSRGRAERGTPKAKPRSDAYVGLLAISLLALTAAMLFAFLNWNTYPEGKPKPVQAAPKGSAGARRRSSGRRSRSESTCRAASTAARAERTACPASAAQVVRRGLRSL